MQAHDVLPHELHKRCFKPGKIILEYEVALNALDAFVRAQWAMLSWEARIPDDRGELRSVYIPHVAQWRYFDWKRGEPWEHYVERSAYLCKETLQHFKSLLNQIPGRKEQILYIHLDALGPHPYVEKIEAIDAAYFSTSQELKIDSSTQSIPLIMATVRKSTHSFSQGQRIYIYDVDWGVNERALVIGKFRRSHRWIRGVCPIASLENFRPTVVFHPAVIKKLSDGCSVHGRLFWRFLARPF